MLRRVVCILCCALCALLVAGHPLVEEHLPVPPQGLTAGPYAGWSGVVRVWVYQGFRTGTGSIVPWLNGCLSTFEKRSSGVYAHVETVSAETMAQASAAGLPPDMLVVTPGALTDGAGLAAVPPVQGLSEGLTASCEWQGSLRAVPLCVGGYGMLLNTELMPQLPADWDATIGQLYSAATRRQGARYALQVPGEGTWPAAAARMLDALPAAQEQLPDDYLACSMVKAWSDFKKGAAACIPASQWHIRQLALLEAKGEGMQYSFVPADDGYTDQYFAAAIVESSMSDAAQREEVCARIIAYLTGEEAQTQLDKALMFSARKGLALYAGQADMAALEEACAHAAEFAPLFG